MRNNVLFSAQREYLTDLYGGKQLAEDLKPEAAYFYLQNGKRTSLLVLDVADPSEIIPLAEPLFSLIKAEISLTPVMNVDDLMKGFRALGVA